MLDALKLLKLLSAAALAVSLGTGASASTSVAPGFDLLRTPNNGQTFFDMGPGFGVVEFVGNWQHVGSPLCGAGQFNFGGGCISTGNADSILHRTEVAFPDSAGNDTIDLQLVALSLRSTQKFDAGFGMEFVEARVLMDMTTGTWVYGMDLGSTMTIHFDDPLDPDAGGTFTSNLHFAVDLIFANSGYHAGTEYITMTQSDASWQRDPWLKPAPTIPGINYHLDGYSHDQDFWPGPALHCAPGKCHGTVPATVPLPPALPMLAAAVGGLGLILRRSQQSRPV